MWNYVAIKFFNLTFNSATGRVLGVRPQVIHNSPSPYPQSIHRLCTLRLCTGLFTELLTNCSQVSYAQRDYPQLFKFIVVVALIDLIVLTSGVTASYAYIAARYCVLIADRFICVDV